MGSLVVQQLGSQDMCTQSPGNKWSSGARVSPTLHFKGVGGDCRTWGVVMLESLLGPQ